MTTPVSTNYEFKLTDTGVGTNSVLQFFQDMAGNDALSNFARLDEILQRFEMLSGAAAPGESTAAEVKQFYLQTGDAPALFQCVGSTTANDVTTYEWKEIPWAADTQSPTNDLTAEAIMADGDYMPFYDSSASGHRKGLLSSLYSYIIGKLLGTTNGLLKANGSGTVSAAAARVDYAAASQCFAATLVVANWDGASAPYTYTLSVTDYPVLAAVTADSNQEILEGFGISEVQLKALQKLNIVDGGQVAGTSITLKTFKDKPAIDLPIRVILRGDM